MESIYSVLAFPQAPINTDIYMKTLKVPYVFPIPDLPAFSDGFLKNYKLLMNLYGLKNSGKTWFELLKEGLLERHWKQSEIDSCLFTKNGILLVVYVDDAILISLHKDLMDTDIKYLQKDYVLTDERELKDYLGTRFTKHSDRSIELSQPRMIERVLEIVGLNDVSDRTNMHATPDVSTALLDYDPDGAPYLQSWNYRSSVGTLSYLQAMVRPDINFSVQQCVRFCNNTRQKHEETVKRICSYLLRTKNKGLILKPEKIVVWNVFSTPIGQALSMIIHTTIPYPPTLDPGILLCMRVVQSFGIIRYNLLFR